MKLIYNFHEDPGHGWLEVPRHMLRELKISHAISAYSYQKGDHVFLEEDMDAATFVNAMKARGFEVGFVRSYKENTPIRNYDSFQP